MGQPKICCYMYPEVGRGHIELKVVVTAILCTMVHRFLKSTSSSFQSNSLQLQMAQMPNVPRLHLTHHTPLWEWPPHKPHSMPNSCHMNAPSSRTSSILRCTIVLHESC